MGVTDLIAFEFVQATDLRPGDTIRLDSTTDPVVLTAVRHHYRAEGDSPTVSLYREPTDAEATKFCEERDQDLRATWISSCVGWFPVLRSVPHQPGDLAY